MYGFEIEKYGNVDVHEVFLSTRKAEIEKIYKLAKQIEKLGKENDMHFSGIKVGNIKSFSDTMLKFRSDEESYDMGITSGKWVERYIKEEVEDMKEEVKFIK